MQAKGNLTRYSEGGIKELWVISFPLMLSTLSMLLTNFVDRIFLTHHSLHALNTSVNASTLAWAFMSGIAMVTAMSEVFVAQYNGERKFKNIGSPVWQMLWVAAGSSLLCFPLALYGSPLFFQEKEEIFCFRSLLLFTPSYALMIALYGFFVGQGKTRLLIWISAVSNGLAIWLDYLLIFGWSDWIPSLGVKGSSIAICFEYFFESTILLCIFLSKKNRLDFGTGNWRLQPTTMVRCLKIGLPQGVLCALEFFGWSCFYWMMTSLSEKHITLSSLCQSFTFLFSFFFDGVYRAVAAIAGNFIGAKRPHLIFKVLSSGFLLLSYFFLVSLSLLFFNPVQVGPEWQSSLKTCMALSFLYLFFDGMRWVISGLLIAAGDTLFLLFVGTLSLWLCLIIPTYAIVYRNHLAVEYAWGFSAAYTGLLFLICFCRFRFFFSPQRVL